MNDTDTDLKIQAEIQKLLAETTNINKKTKWYEAVLLVAAVTALLAAGKYLF